MKKLWKDICDGAGHGIVWPETKNVLGGFIIFCLFDEFGFNPGWVRVIENPNGDSDGLGGDMTYWRMFGRRKQLAAML